MSNSARNSPEIDWSLTTYEGSRREQLRRWAKLPLEDALEALEAMHELAEELGATPDSDRRAMPGGDLGKR